MLSLVLPLLIAAESPASAPASQAPTAVKSPEGFEIVRVPGADESIYVTQRRAYTKRSHLEFTPMFTALLNNRFVSSMGLWGSLVYHFREGLALEAIGGYSGRPFTRYSDATLELLADPISSEPLPPDKVFVEWFAGLDLQWAPFYGKLRLIPGILGDYDLYVLGGFGVVGTQAPCLIEGVYNGMGMANGRDVQGITGTCSSNQTYASLRYDLRFAGHFGGGFRIFFTRWFGARIEVRDLIYSILINSVKADPITGTRTEVTTDIRNNIQFVFGLSFLI